MSSIGLFFGTDTGSTRKIAKMIQKRYPDAIDKPLNVNRITPEDMLAYDRLILGTSTLRDGRLPGLASTAQMEGWLEFLPKLEAANADFTGKTVALYGLGCQEKYPDTFCNGLGILHEFIAARGAKCIGQWPSDGYVFNESKAIGPDGQFVGLALDNDVEHMKTDERLNEWLKLITPELGLPSV
ncbi:flavodoxin [Magnetofaba australis]|uniref:Flavodoxin n=1 Tax=Magnetofaba australis IT-1 TaxID=1434232 RepID=A0A1Y2K701_9PROT|nr:flavodoxin [Magnetofaba australis]OSM04122.1 putative flavodoxin [Magnetofaba australis IT-1]